jgi:hypothetical protein
MKRLLVCVMAVAALAVGSTKAYADLIIVDSGKIAGTDATWTLSSESGCTTCTVTLDVVFTGNTEYDGTFLDGIQWKVDGADLTGATLTSTTAGATTDWSTTVDASLNQGAGGTCGGGGNDNLCADYVGAISTAGFGPITDGMALSWTWEATYAGAGLPDTLTGGNIRGLFNNADGSNYNIFSPGGGSFEGEGGGSTEGEGGGSSPEPASMLLFGVALSAAGLRMRRSRS